jgi:hypothetical protein
MPNPRKPELGAEARRRNQEQFARLGGQLKASRRRRRLTQRQLGAIADLSQSGVSLAERGHGGSLSVDTWQRLFTSVDRRLLVDVSRDALEDVADAGHLAIQELILRLARAAGMPRTFELPTRPGVSRHSVDVALRQDAHRVLILVEAWNSFGDVGGAIRSTQQKVAEAAALGIVVGGDRPYRVSSCWVVRRTARNRALIDRYPTLFDARFPGSSAGWVAALTQGTAPPAEPGLVWCDIGCTRLFTRRRSRPPDDAVARPFVPRAGGPSASAGKHPLRAPATTTVRTRRREEP